MIAALSFLTISGSSLLGLHSPIWYSIALLILVELVLQFLPLERRLYAIRDNCGAALLAGIRVPRSLRIRFFGALERHRRRRHCVPARLGAARTRAVIPDAGHCLGVPGCDHDPSRPLQRTRYGGCGVPWP